MKHLPVLAAFVSTALAVTLAAATGVPKTVNYVNHEKVAAVMVKGGSIVNDNGLVVLANRGVQRGAEVHAKTNHVFIIVDGEADFVTGGKMIDPKEISPGQIRGPGIEGGQVHRLTKGDVITIPAGTPHQWKDTSKTGSVGYYAVNIEQE
jgi:mannose-6-phosphate isomerase-like protein (cupin superfamily)